MTIRKLECGFSLIELLIVCGILGIISAIAIPMYINSVNRGKQGKTMADMKTIAVAWELRAADKKAYNAAGATTFTCPTNVVPPTDMSSMLEPTYLRPLPRTDGWGHPFEFRLDQTVGSSAAAATYAIRSPGRDGLWDGTTYTPGPIKRLDQDLVYSNGGFITYSEGAQH